MCDASEKIKNDILFMGIPNLMIKATLEELEIPLNKIISQNIEASHF